MIKRILKRFLAYIEIYSYSRVLKDCEYLLTEEQRQNVIMNMKNARLKYSSN